MASFPTAGNDTIDGTNGKDVIDALGGDDVINGYGGNDILKGSAGDDDITGGTGNDNLYGLAGTDTARYANTTVQAASTAPAVMGTWAGALLTLTTGTVDGTDVLNAFEKLWMNGVMFDVNVSARNVVAITGADTANASEDGPNVLGNVLANDYDIDSQLSVTGISFDGTPGTVGVAIAGDYGSLTINSDGTYSYDPAPDSTGTDVFTYTVLDGGLPRNVTLTVNVVAVNDPPVANDSTNSGDEDTEIQGTVTASDPDSVPTFNVDTGPSHGVLVLQPDGTYTYTPDANYHGSDSFTFTASDGTSTDVGQVDLTINSVPNDTLVVGAGGYATIQEAIDAAEAGDTIQITAGTYSENVLVNKSGITIVGIGEVNLVGTFKTDNGIAGDVNSWLETAVAYDNGSGHAFTVSGNDVSISNINIDSYYIGIETVGDITGLSLEDVDVSNGIFGLHKELANASIDGLTVTGGSFSNLHIGIDFEKDPNVVGNEVINFTLDGTHFEDITAKGFYAETLTNGHLTNFTMTNVGYFGGTPSFGGYAGAGIELNLKRGTYSGIEIDHFTMTNVGQSTRFGSSHDNAAAISIKPRDDSGSYTPVSITDVVRIHDGTIDGTSTGIRNGESGKVNQTGDFEIENVVITGAVHNAQNGDIESRSAANIGVIGSTGADSWVVSPQSVGTISFDLGDGDDTVDGGTSTGVLTIDGGAGADSLTGGSGDDSLTGGGGADTLVGGLGVDTAHYEADINLGDISYAGGVFSLDADGGDTLDGVERVVDGTGQVFWLVEAGGSIQAAINGAAAGDTIVVAEGVYTESLTISGKPLNFQAIGDVTVTASAVGSTVLVTGAFAGGDLSFDGFTIAGSNGASIIAGGMYVNVTGMGELSFTNGAFEGNAYTGLYVYNSGIDQLTVTDSVFDNNGETGLNSGAQIKLIGLQGDALLQNLVLNGNVGGPDVPNSADRPDYGLEIHGTENALLATEDTVPIGTVTIDNVVITGDFHKSGLAINNYQNLDGLTITDVDLSGATADWAGSGTSVLNVDGIRESYDASAWDVTLPVQDRATSLRGEHNTESPAGQTITGTSSADQMWGNGGDDLLIGGAGDDLIDGQAGTDTVRLSDLSTAATAVQAGAVLTVTSASGIDILTAVEAVEFSDRTVAVNNGNAVLIDADNTASVNEGDAVNGNVLTDVFDLDADTITVTALLDHNGDAVTPNGQGRFVVAAAHGFLTVDADGSYTYTATDPSLSAGQIVTEVFTYTASDGGDTATQTLTISVTGESNPIIGNGSANVLNGGMYDDVIFGLGGNDQLNGNDGADYLDGGSGNDQLNGGSGADEMVGGTGNDSYWVDNVGDTVTEEDGGGTDAVNSSITFVLGNFVENLTLSGGDNLDGTGNSSVNSLNGNSGNNTLSGMTGNDILHGNGGNDVLIGGTGNDQMWGEAGGDHFRFFDESVLLSGTREADVVRDFNASEGDRIDLSAIDADTTVGGDQAFSIVGAFSHVAGQLIVVVAGGSTSLRMDVNGDGVEDYRVTLTGSHAGTTILTGGEPDSEGGWIL